MGFNSPLRGRCAVIRSTELAMSFNSPPVGEMPRRGREGNTPKAWLLLFQMEFDFSPALFLLFLPSSQISLPKARGFGGTLNPAWNGCLRTGTSKTLINKGLQSRVSGDALFTRATEHPPWRYPKYVGLRAAFLRRPKYSGFICQKTRRGQHSNAVFWRRKPLSQGMTLNCRSNSPVSKSGSPTTPLKLPTRCWMNSPAPPWMP